MGECLGMELVQLAVGEASAPVESDIHCGPI
jgi:hypothetical protein